MVTSTLLYRQIIVISVMQMQKVKQGRRGCEGWASICNKYMNSMFLTEEIMTVECCLLLVYLSRWSLTAKKGLFSAFRIYECKVNLFYYHFTTKS